LEFRDTAHGQNDNSFHQLTNSILENTLALFTAK